MNKLSFSKSEAIKYGWTAIINNFSLLIPIVAANFFLNTTFVLIENIYDSSMPYMSISFRAIGSFISMAIDIGLIRICLKIYDNHDARFSDLISEFNLLFNFLICSTIYGLIILTGLMLFIIPGIIWAIKYGFSPYIIIDEDVNPIDALKKSACITRGAKGNLFLLGLVLLGINILGLLALIVGVIITIPMTIAALTFLYQKLKTSKLTQLESAHKPSDKRCLRSQHLKWLIPVLLGLYFLVIYEQFFKTFVVQAYKIPSGAMEPTLLAGDMILANKFIYHFKEPKYGEVIIFAYPKDTSKDFIKRAIGFGGNKIFIKDKNLFINDMSNDDPYGVYKDQTVIPGNLQPRDNYGPEIVPENSYFVLGDNRDQSADSRFWGFVDRDYVKAKASFIYWSWDKSNNRVRWERIGKAVH